MDITPTIPQGRQIVTGYGNGGFKINQEFVEGSLLISAEQSSPWNISDASEITLASLQLIFDIKPSIELLLLGTGKTMVTPDPTLRQALKARGIALETMDTGAACRTYNILLAEERRVAAALIAV